MQLPLMITPKHAPVGACELLLEVRVEKVETVRDEDVPVVVTVT